MCPTGPLALKNTILLLSKSNLHCLNASVPVGVYNCFTPLMYSCHFFFMRFVYSSDILTNTLKLSPSTGSTYAVGTLLHSSQYYRPLATPPTLYRSTLPSGTGNSVGSISGSGIGTTLIPS